MPPAADLRNYTPTDRLIGSVDQALRTLLGGNSATRPYPAEGIAETVDQHTERRHAAALMRVNHSGEVAAQALYQGQAAVAASSSTESALLEAAREESDHLAWCATRIEELGGRTSLSIRCGTRAHSRSARSPDWAADRTSLGFVAETERQVVEHLEGHLHRLPQSDARTRAIVQQMSVDEERHGHNALNAGGATLPPLARAMMKVTARIMTRTAYWL
jgi:ubiquinone biosynthesis monooxygenase Coq7